MTLRDFLKNATDDANYYIGAEDGGGFFFIGKPSDALKDLDDINKTKLNSLKKTVKDAKSFIKALKTSSDPAAAVEISRRTTNLNAANKKLKSWKNLLDREIISVDRKKTEPGFNVVVEGYFVGKCWFLHEYNKTKVKKSPKEIHPDGVDFLRTAILTKAAEDYKYTLEYKRKNGRDPKIPHMSQAALEAFFKSNWFNDLCDLDGKDVMYLIRRQVVEEELDAVNKQKEFEAACR